MAGRARRAAAVGPRQTDAYWPRCGVARHHPTGVVRTISPTRVVWNYARRHRPLPAPVREARRGPHGSPAPLPRLRRHLLDAQGGAGVEAYLGMGPLIPRRGRRHHQVSSRNTCRSGGVQHGVFCSPRRRRRQHQASTSRRRRPAPTPPYAWLGARPRRPTGPTGRGWMYHFRTPGSATPTVAGLRSSRGRVERRRTRRAAVKREREIDRNEQRSPGRTAGRRGSWSNLMHSINGLRVRQPADGPSSAASTCAGTTEHPGSFAALARETRSCRWARMDGSTCLPASMVVADMVPTPGRVAVPLPRQRPSPPG